MHTKTNSSIGLNQFILTLIYWIILTFNIIINIWWIIIRFETLLVLNNLLPYGLPFVTSLWNYIFFTIIFLRSQKITSILLRRNTNCGKGFILIMIVCSTSYLSQSLRKRILTGWSNMNKPPMLRTLWQITWK